MQTLRNKKSNKEERRIYFLVPLFIFTLALGAQLGIRTEVLTDFTLQTLVLGLFYYYLPRKFRLISILSYVLLGIVGLPIFSNGQSGWQYFISVPLGFFLGFIASSYIRPPSDQRIAAIFGYFVLVHILIVVLGLIGIAYYTRSQSEVMETLYTLLPGMVVKSIAGTALVWLIAKLRSAFHSGNAR